MFAVRALIVCFLAFASASLASYARAIDRIVRTVPGAAGNAVAWNGPGLIYVANSASNRVAVAQSVEPYYVPVGPDPRYIAAAGDVLVSNAGDASLSVFGAYDRTSTAYAIQASGPITIDAARRKAYVLHLKGGREVTVFDLPSRTWYAIDIGASAPTDFVLDAAGQRLYVSHALTGEVIAIDVSNTSPTPPSARIAVGGRPGPIAFNRKTRKVYVLTDSAAAPLVEIDGATFATRSVSVPGHMVGARAIAVNALTGTVYAGFANEVVVMDAVTRNLTFIPSAEVRAIVSDDSDEGLGNYVIDAAGNLIIIDGWTNLATTVPIGKDLSAVTYTARGHDVLVVGPTALTVLYGLSNSHATPNINAQGLWWATNGAESGWGINFAHQGFTLFATWFTYDAQGRAQWLVMSNGVQDFGNQYSGTLYRTTGPPFGAIPFDPSKVTRTPVGTLFVHIDNANNATLSATVDGVKITKDLSRQVFAVPAPTCAEDGVAGSIPNYQDLWWNAPAGSESGWGLNITHQGDKLFITWFTYDGDGRPMWLVGSDIAKTGNATYSGTLYRTAGPPLAASPWDASRVTRMPAGTATLTFSDSANGTFTYTVDGVSASKAITRQVFASPATVCK